MQSAIVVVVFSEKNMPSLKNEKVVVVSGSRGLQKTELQDFQLGVVM